MKNINQAQKILEKEPLPQDAREQVDALYEQSSSEEKELFSMIYEGLSLLEVAE